VLNLGAVRRVFEAKGRPADNPLIVHVAPLIKLDEIIDEMPTKGQLLIEAFWPGPLTLVVKKTILISDLVSGELDTVAVRMPKNDVALGLINALGEAIVGPSANLSGRPSPTTADDVYDDLRGKVELILDAGPTEIGLESTVVDVTLDPPLILRRGGVSQEALERVIGTVEVGTGEQLRRSPGTRYRHYAPRARVVLLPIKQKSEFARELQAHRQRGEKVACIVHSTPLSALESGELYRVLPSSLPMFARYLFRTLRELDALGVDVILVEGVAEEGIGAAIMDRLRKAAQS
jgi:L-threonylcarbamoyladenylate synthase